MLKFKLNVAERKTLAKRMEELTGIHPYYTKAPLYSYDIGSYTIDRNGNLLVEPENADAELLTTLLNEGLIRGGESIESTDDQMENTEPTDHLEEDPVTEDTEAETEVLDEQESEDESTTEGNEPAEAESEEASEPDNAAEDEPDAEEPESEEQSEAEDQPEEVPLDLELAFPVSQHNGVTLRNLVNLLYSRGKLIGKATGGHFHVEEGLVEKLKDDSCTFAIMNFIRNLVNIMAAHEQQIGRAIRIDAGRTGQYCQVVNHRFLDRLNREKPTTMHRLEDIWYEGNGSSWENRNAHYNSSRYHMLNLHATFTKGTIEFRLFQFADPADGKCNGLHAGEMKAYIQLCLAMSQLAKMVRTASPKPQQTDNEKYAMRCWMLRLGFIGDEFATAREILLRNMEGNASWRNK